MQLEYTLLDPSKNMTVLVETAVPAELQPKAAAAIMAAEPSCEQVGFVSFDAEGCDALLRMAGGEFCGNASMSAAVLAYLRCPKEEISISICNQLVPVRIVPQDGQWLGTVVMPQALSVEGNTVHFSGISHIIYEAALEKADAEALVRQKCAQLNVDALGLMMLDEKAGSITPLVYVPGADTIFWEQSCASGTSAVGVYLAAKYGCTVERSFIEPGSSLSVCASPNEAPRLSGTVKIIYRKTMSF